MSATDMSYEVIIDISDIEHRSFNFKRLFDESIPCKERIVRCRDCVYRRRSWNGHEPNVIGNWFCSYTGGHEVEPDGFCAWGERRVRGVQR